MRKSDLRDLDMPLFVLKDTPSCSTVDPELFFPQEEMPDGRQTRPIYRNLLEAKKICESCPLKLECLEFALKNGEIGIWGGTTEEQRKSLRRRVGISGVKQYRTPITW